MKRFKFLVFRFLYWMIWNLVQQNYQLLNPLCFLKALISYVTLQYVKSWLLSKLSDLESFFFCVFLPFNWLDFHKSTLSAPLHFLRLNHYCITTDCRIFFLSDSQRNSLKHTPSSRTSRTRAMSSYSLTTACLLWKDWRKTLTVWWVRCPYSFQTMTFLSTYMLEYIWKQAFYVTTAC